jgi:hypothetical protein
MLTAKKLVLLYSKKKKKNINPFVKFEGCGNADAIVYKNVV